MKTTEKSRLIDEIEASLANRNCPLWFPELSPKLAHAAWESLRGDAGLTMHSYGTGRVLARDPAAPRIEVARLPIPQPSNGPESHFLVELLKGSAARRYEELGLDFATGDDIAEASAVDCIRDAMSILGRVSNLRDTIVQLVKVVHIVRSQGDDYDVSHSDPLVPFSIFVSVPERRTPNADLRVSESIIHEAMHLQLTLIESLEPLVTSTRSQYFSPWKTAYRAPAGILHGLYVFRVIDAYLELISSIYYESKEIRDYVEERRQAIKAEIKEISSFRDCPDLTELGSQLTERLLSA